MKTSILFIDLQGEQLASFEMGSLPRVGEQVQIGPTTGPKSRFTVRAVIWQAFTETPICNSAVIVLG